MLRPLDKGTRKREVINRLCKTKRDVNTIKTRKIDEENGTFLNEDLRCARQKSKAQSNVEKYIQIAML